MSGRQRIGVVISILWLIASTTYLLVTKNQAANKSYAACIESSLTTGTHLRYIGQNDQADAWERHSKDWCLGAAGYMSPVGLAHALLEGSYRSAHLVGCFLGANRAAVACRKRRDWHSPVGGAQVAVH